MAFVNIWQTLFEHLFFMCQCSGDETSEFTESSKQVIFSLVNIYKDQK